MLRLSKYLLLLAFCSCAQSPKPMVYEQWVLTPEEADQSLAIDDQFLQKSRKSALSPSRLGGGKKDSALPL